MNETTLTDAKWCTPMWGSCALLSGHNGPHHGYPENIAAIVAEAVDRERAAWATKVREAADRYHANGCHYRHQQGDTDECNSCTAFDIEALLAADDTEGTP